MAIQRIAIIFDSQSRPETTGFYCRRALSKFAPVEQFLPNELARIPRNVFDLFINIDDGYDYHLPKDLTPAPFGRSIRTSDTPPFGKRPRILTGSLVLKRMARSTCSPMV